MARMTFADVKDLPRRLNFRVHKRLQAWLASDHGAAQRMAGMAFLIRVANAAIVFGSQILMARWMGSTEFGAYVYAWTWMLLVGDMIHLGLPTTAQRFIPEYAQRGAFDMLRGFLFASRWLTFAAGTAAALLGALLIFAAGGAIDRNIALPLYLACISVPFYTVCNTFDGIARSYNWVHVGLAPPFVLRPLLLIAMLAGLHGIGLPIDATVAMAALTIAVWVSALVQLVLLERRLATVVQPGIRSYALKPWLVVSLSTVVAWSFYTLLTYTDVLVLKQFRPGDEVAYYYAAAKTLALVSFIYFSVSAAVAHRFSALHAAGDRDGLSALVAGAVRWTFWPSLAGIVLLLALGKPMLRLFGPAFESGYPLMFILSIGLLARASVGPAERVLNMLGQQRACARVYAAAFIMNLAGCLLLAPSFGAMGVAGSIASAIVAESVLLFLVAKRKLDLHLFIWKSPIPRD